MVIDIIIVNWNAGEQLAKCLSSIVRFDAGNVKRVVVVDNASSDNSADGLERFGLTLEIIRNQKNLGFARACNQGAAICDAPYLLFLNPDTELFKNSLAVPLAFMKDKANKEVGICGIQLVGKDGKVSRTCAYFPSLVRLIAQAVGLTKFPWLHGTGVHMLDWDHLTGRSVDHVIGAFFFTRRKVFETLKGFDERFFVYLEDLDFSFRAKQVGWKTYYLADAQAFHVGGGTSRQVKASRLFYSLRSRLLYGFKHFSSWQAWILVSVTMYLELITRLLFCAGRGNWTGVQDTLLGYQMLWKALPAVIYYRHKRDE